MPAIPIVLQFLYDFLPFHSLLKKVVMDGMVRGRSGMVLQCPEGMLPALGE
ncbi:MAG: hypothetical protein OXI53_11265 [Nitrospira sp.]|nr:hypothetical protein [Nitrospira sp.]MDE0405875.1 hypothetical protein [Nitrospira sp.]MDE0487395.1 hypothetical protein [Nitrospira sp.]